MGRPLEMTGSVRHDFYRPDVDGLRALSVLAVVGFHAFPNWVRGGFVGVDVFFVISGYLITSVILDDVERDRFSFRQFYARRARRLFPSLIPVLLVSLVLGWFLMTAPEFAQLGKHVFAAATFTSNFALWREAGYFDSTVALKPLLHLWSLGIEEQFYIVWPLGLLLLVKARRSILPAIGLLGIASFVLNIYLTRTSPSAAFFLPFPRAWELLVGASLAMTENFARGQRIWARALPAATLHVFAAAGLLIIVATAVALPRESEFPGWWALPPTIAALMIIIAGPRAWTNRTILGNRAAVYVGLISYPIYLWHWPLLSFARLVANQTPSRTVRIAVVLITFPLAWTTYEFVEKRARNRIASGARSTRLLAALVLAIVLAVIGVTGLSALGGAVFFHTLFRFGASSRQSLARNSFPDIPRRHAGKDAVRRRLRCRSRFLYRSTARRSERSRSIHW
jgi:peptidoglycan/LPS O-acetylase OafA/YrhL